VKESLFLTHRIRDVLGFGGTKTGSGGGEIVDTAGVGERGQPCGLSKGEGALQAGRSHRQDFVPVIFGHRENEIGIRSQRRRQTSGLKISGVAAEIRENPCRSRLDRVSDHRPGAGTRSGESGGPGFSGVGTREAFTGR